MLQGISPVRHNIPPPPPCPPFLESLSLRFSLFFLGTAGRPSFSLLPFLPPFGPRLSLPPAVPVFSLFGPFFSRRSQVPPFVRTEVVPFHHAFGTLAHRYAFPSHSRSAACPGFVLEGPRSNPGRPNDFLTHGRGLLFKGRGSPLAVDGLFHRRLDPYWSLAFPLGCFLKV